MRAHLGDPCIYCGTPHDEVAVGECPETDLKEIAQGVIGEGYGLAGRYAWHYIGEDTAKELVLDALREVAHTVFKR